MIVLQNWKDQHLSKYQKISRQGPFLDGTKYQMEMPMTIIRESTTPINNNKEIVPKNYIRGLFSSFLLSLSSRGHSVEDSSKRRYLSLLPFKISNLQMLLFIILSLLPMSSYGQGGDFHFPSSGLGTRSRFNNFAGTPNTDLTMSFITNISEAAPKGTFIAQFGVSQQNSKFT